MLQWIKERLKEPSTWQGISGLVGVLGYTMSPELGETIATTAVGIITLIQIVRKEIRDADSGGSKGQG